MYRALVVLGLVVLGGLLTGGGWLGGATGARPVIDSLYRGTERPVSVAGAAVVLDTPTPLPTYTAVPTVTGTPPTATPTPSCDWNYVSMPAFGANSSLHGVAVLAAADIWAVGSTCPGFCSSSALQTLIVHWDGSAWRRVPSPNPGGEYRPHLAPQSRRPGGQRRVGRGIYRPRPGRVAADVHSALGW